ncbi:MAG: hypothetical protein E7452_07515 [Ruminococcaceae bacterium]|nr:hypothetical protein [Oscillospiraceae bacterium]
MTKTVIPRRLLLLLSVLLLLPLAACGESPQNIRYTAEEVVYLAQGLGTPEEWADPENRRYSLGYHRNADGQFFQCVTYHTTGEVVWYPVGQLEEIDLVEPVFCRAFRSTGTIPPEDLFAENETAYQIAMPEIAYDGGYAGFYSLYLLEQKNGEIYLIEWIDTSRYSPDRPDDPITAVTAYRLSAMQTNEAMAVDGDAMYHGGYQTLAAVVTSKRGRGIVLTAENGRYRIPQETWQLIEQNVEIGNEILFTYLGGVTDSSPRRIDAAVRIEITHSADAELSVPTVLDATTSTHWLGYWEITPPKGVFPENSKVFVSADGIDMTEELWISLVEAQYPAQVRLTTTGVAFCYDRADGTTEYWIKATAIELIETQP